MRRIDNDERRDRLVRRHFLAEPAETVEQVAERLVGLHSSDPATVYLSARARLTDFTRDELEDALYERRSLLRMLGMRRTMFVVPPEVAATMDAACTKALAPAERRRLAGYLEDQGIARDGDAWIDEVGSATLAALHARGQATANELRKDVPELTRKLTFGEGKRWGGAVGVSTRILFLLATEGAIVRTRPLGSWLSSQYRWAPTGTWLDGGLADRPVEEAEQDLVRRWLGAFGPGTEADIKWWTGWGIRQTRRIIADVGAVPVEVEGGTAYVLPDDVERATRARPHVTLLPSLDPTVMGWKQREWYLGDHQQRLFDTNGNAGPTVWIDGRIVGGWAQTARGEVVTQVLEDVGAERRSTVEAAAAQLTEWLGDTIVTPRFRSPLEKELAVRN